MHALLPPHACLLHCAGDQQAADSSRDRPARQRIPTGLPADPCQPCHRHPSCGRVRGCAGNKAACRALAPEAAGAVCRGPSWGRRCCRTWCAVLWGAGFPPCSSCCCIMLPGCNASGLRLAQVTACTKRWLAVLQAALHALRQCMSVGAPAVRIACTARTHARTQTCCPTPRTPSLSASRVSHCGVAACACSQVCCMPCWTVLRLARRCAGSWQVGACSHWLQPSRRSRCGAALKQTS